jgi:hypothetical protein
MVFSLRCYSQPIVPVQNQHKGDLIKRAHQRCHARNSVFHSFCLYLNCQLPLESKRFVSLGATPVGERRSQSRAGFRGSLAYGVLALVVKMAFIDGWFGYMELRKRQGFRVAFFLITSRSQPINERRRSGARNQCWPPPPTTRAGRTGPGRPCLKQ